MSVPALTGFMASMMNVSNSGGLSWVLGKDDGFCPLFLLQNGFGMSCVLNGSSG